jgi:type IV pilus assembly protein PilY1
MQPKNIIKPQLHLQACKLLVRGMALLVALNANPAQAVVSQAPLFVAPQPNPNIMFTLDNSGSMAWEYLPDTLPNVDLSKTTFASVEDSLSVAKFRSASINHLAYDPAIHYLPWQNANGSYYDNATPTAARDNPQDGTSVTNLIQVQNNADNPYYAFFYVFSGKNIERFSNYKRMTITSGWAGVKGPARDDCKATTCTYDEEIQNFANWYTYHRKRIYTAIAGVSQAFNSLDGKQRIGFGQINNPKDGTVDGVSNDTVILGVRDFTGDNRAAFYTQLFASTSPNGGTPLRRALDDVGQYFSRTDKRGPWAEFPGSSLGTEYACRKTFHILMTDGYWNGGAATTAGASDADNVDGPVIINPKNNATYQYKAADSTYYNSDAKNTLADIAMYYWNHDLRPNLGNYVLPVSSDPAFWQHIVQYTVGLGVDGTLQYPADEAALKAGTKQWPDPKPNPKADPTEAAVDDLWHAAVNGHGLYFSVKNPKTFRDGLSAALADIGTQVGASATVAINFDRTGGTGALAYVPSFESGQWSGHLLAYGVDANGDLDMSKKMWDAADKLPVWSSRNIVTWNPDTGKAVTFDWAKLTVGQQTYLGSTDVQDYLKGNSVKERINGGVFRNRATRLGDIVNSAPLFVHQLDFGYQAVPSTGGGGTYRAFFKANDARTPMLYVGANDGMLHAFDAASGVETFAYIPNSVYPNLKSLSDPAYAHRYFVDGQLSQGDAYLADDGTGHGAWRTLLVGSTGAGAKSVFALDVTSPTISGIPALGAANVKWERSAVGDNDMGYMLGRAEVVRLRNGKWAAIYGNGYESANKQAVLYVVDAFTGQAITGLSDRISTGAGGASAPNGLSTPALVFNAARELVGAYAGDLQGNLWKFEFDATGKGTVAFSGSPLFVAKDKSTPAVVQPIVQRPALGIHPLGGYMVMFGTGKFFETGDNGDTQLQTAYGIWDNPAAGRITQARALALQEQTLTAQTGGASLTSVVVDWKTQRGWFVDLGLSSGSRAVGNPYVTDETTFWLTTLTPVGTICLAGGKSQLLAIDYLTGGASSVFSSNDTSGGSGSGTALSAVDIGATATDGRIASVPPAVPGKCGTAGQPACTCGGTNQPACTCGGKDQPLCADPVQQCPSRKVIVNQLDGSITERTINGQCKPPLRVWHQLDVSY